MAFTFSYNNLYAGYNATPASGVWYDFKTFMKNNGFKVIASGDGLSKVLIDPTGTAGDCITGGGTGAGKFGNTFAWFVIQEPTAYVGVKRQWLFWKWDTTTTSLNGGPFYSWQGFVPNSAYTDGQITSVVSNTVTFSAAEVATLNVVAGMSIAISGSSNAHNNGVFLVASVTGTSLTFTNATGATTASGLTWTVLHGHQNAVVSPTNAPLGLDEFCLWEQTRAPRSFYTLAPSAGGPTPQTLNENGTSGNYYAHFAVSTSTPNAWYALFTHGGNTAPATSNLFGYDPLTNYDSSNLDPTVQIGFFNTSYTLGKLGSSRYNAFTVISKADGLLNPNNTYFSSYAGHLQYWSNTSNNQQGWMYGNDWCMPTIVCNSTNGGITTPVPIYAKSSSGLAGREYAYYNGISSLFISNTPTRAFGNLISYNGQTYMPYNNLSLICNGSFPSA